VVPSGKILAAEGRIKHKLIPPKNRSPEGTGVPMSIGSWNKCNLIGTNIFSKNLYEGKLPTFT